MPYYEKVIENVTVKVSLAETVTFADTCEYMIPESAVTLAVVVFPSPKRPNSLCVPVASHAAKNTAIVATFAENEPDPASFRVVSFPSCKSHGAGVVTLSPSAIYRLSHI